MQKAVILKLRQPLTAVALVASLLGAPSGWAADGPMDFLFPSTSGTGSVGPNSGARVWRFSEFGAVRLEPTEQPGQVNTQPMALEATALQGLLASVEWQASSGKFMSLFSRSELDDLTPALARALEAATSSEDVLLLSSARREVGLLSLPQVLTARLFVSGRGLNLIVSEARSDALALYRTTHVAPEFAFGSRAKPSQVVLRARGANAERADWLQWPLAGTGAAPSPARPSSAASTIPPTQNGQSPSDGLYEQQEQRLKGLKRLHEQHLLTDDEYQHKRQAIIDSL